MSSRCEPHVKGISKISFEKRKKNIFKEFINITPLNISTKELAAKLVIINVIGNYPCNIYKFTIRGLVTSLAVTNVFLDNW